MKDVEEGSVRHTHPSPVHPPRHLLPTCSSSIPGRDDDFIPAHAPPPRPPPRLDIVHAKAVRVFCSLWRAGGGLGRRNPWSGLVGGTEMGGGGGVLMLYATCAPAVDGRVFPGGQF